MTPRSRGAFRIARAFKYSSFALASIVGLVYAHTFESYAWSVLFLLGSIACIAGVVTKTWVGEFIGLWPVVSCLGMFSLGCFLDVDQLSPQRVFLGLIFLGFAFSSFARYQDVRFQKRLSDYDRRTRAGRPGL